MTEVSLGVRLVQIDTGETNTAIECETHTELFTDSMTEGTLRLYESTRPATVNLSYCVSVGFSPHRRV